MVQGITTRRQDRPLLTTVLPVKVLPPATWKAIRVLKELPTISDRMNPSTKAYRAITLNPGEECFLAGSD
jgi:hypothetical protein